MTSTSSHKSPDSQWFLIALIATLAAVLIHGYLSYRHLEVTYGDATTSSICNIDDTYNCDAVAASKYSSFLGIPLAVGGLVTNLILLLFALSYRFTYKDGDHFNGRMAVYISSFVLLMSIVMGAISLTQLSVYCLFCIIAYVLSLFSFLGFFLSTPSPFGEIPSDLSSLFSSRRGSLGLLIAIPALSWLVNGMLTSSFQGEAAGQMDQFIEYQFSEWKRASSHEFSHLSGLALGASKESAKMIIHEFADFRCGHCRTAAPKLHNFTKANADVRLVFLSYPLDGACNSNLSRSSGISCQLAKMVICAKDKGWKAHDFIFENQRKFSSQREADILLQQFAEDSSLNWSDIQSCINSESVDQEIRRQVSAASAAGVQGTPAIFVNGKRLNGGQDLNLLKKVYADISGE